MPAPTCLGEVTDFVFSTENLVVNNLAGELADGKKEMRFKNAGVDLDGRSFDFVVGELAGVAWSIGTG